MAVKDNTYARDIVDKGIVYFQTPLVSKEYDQDHITYISKTISKLFVICVTNTGSSETYFKLNGDDVPAEKFIVKDLVVNKNYISIAKLEDLKIGDKITTRNTASVQVANKFSSLIFMVEGNNVTYHSNYATTNKAEDIKFNDILTVEGRNKTYYCIATSEYNASYIKTPKEISITVESEKEIFKEETIYSSLQDNKPCCLIKKFTNLNAGDKINTTTFGVKYGNLDLRGVSICVEV